MYSKALPVKKMRKEIKSIIKQLRDLEIGCFDVPEEYAKDRNIISAERQLGLRELGRRGYDVIRNMFFVEEELSNGSCSREEITYFDDFESYSAFIDGKIYDEACYYQCDFSKIGTKVDYARLNRQKFFVEDTIDDYTVPLTIEKVCYYEEAEQAKKHHKNWTDKLNNCSTVSELLEVRDATYADELCSRLMGFSRKYENFFIWQYLFSALNDKKRFNVLMEYIANYAPNVFLVEVCTMFGSDAVMQAFNSIGFPEQTENKLKRQLKIIVEAIENRLVDKSVSAYFDGITHYYCEVCQYVSQDAKLCKLLGYSSTIYRYFETFESFIEYRKGDLTNCDLTKALKLDYDFTKCKTDNTTKLPLAYGDKLHYVIKKEYFNNEFNITIEWYSSKGVFLKRTTRTFEYFFDFVAFMEGDLSDADLLLCDGLQNLSDISGMNFDNAKIRSAICDKLGIRYKSYKNDNNKLASFSSTEENEKNTEIELQASRELDTYDYAERRIYYISDIHISHKLAYFNPKSETDVEYVIGSIVHDIVEDVEESGSIILIGGDSSSDFSIFELFIRMLRNALDRAERNPYVIFILGNHELWGFSQSSFDEIVIKYNNLINECGMYLLQNDILYVDSERIIHRITTEEIVSLGNKELREKTRTARTVFFGGLAFSGYNEGFNADAGVYQCTIDRDTEIKETKKFEKLYNKICSAFFDKNVVVFTHMPMECWSESVNYHKSFVYVSGHTHRNYFYDDADIRIYADNQAGYKNKTVHMKSFNLGITYDYFADYQDGIYEITAHDYREFYRGKNLGMTFNRTVYILYMLKKNGYYCFVCESEFGKLSLLNGGALKRLELDDIRYCYENMDAVIARIKKPLDAYTKFQKAISAEIQKIGGDGHIHGCIIDIDWYNHIYVNPTDMKITGYYASNMACKKVYPTIPALLKAECPALYAKYTKLLKEKHNSIHNLEKYENNKLATSPQIYLDTDIYKASREIKKMQKLYSNVLTTWYETDGINKMIESKL